MYGGRSGDSSSSSSSGDEEVRNTHNRGKNILYMHGHRHTCVLIFFIYFQCVTIMINFYLRFKWTKYIIHTFYIYTVCMVFFCYSLSLSLFGFLFVFMNKSFQFFSHLNCISLLSSSRVAAWMYMS